MFREMKSVITLHAILARKDSAVPFELNCVVNFLKLYFRCNKNAPLYTCV